MPKLLLAGAGHAHMAVMAAIPQLRARGHQVTAIGPGHRHSYSGMGPGMLGGAYTPDEISFPVRNMIENRGGEFITGIVATINPRRNRVVLESGQEVPYDVLSCNLGSFVPDDILASGPDEPSFQSLASRNIFPVKPIEQLFWARQRIQELAQDRQVRIGVCGGGAASVEVAGNAWVAAMSGEGKGGIVQLFARGALLKTMPEKVRGLVRKTFRGRKIKIFEESPVLSVHNGSILLANGQSHTQDMIFLALGVKPSSVFRASGLEVSRDGGLLVNQFLQCPAHPDIFGGGDCITFSPQPLAKVGVYAVRQNPVLRHNLQAQLEGRPLEPFDPGGGYLLIFNLGGGYGILHKNGFAFGGRTAFRIKDYIDRKFIQKYAITRSLSTDD
ncbi:NAD(P)/FAD-dependent oxidoreductase [Desulfonatronum thioautotrophicum]|uniref:NAD(P)/FAD-dependent oxidoreductase n=1 Tax=Desulfonatronum thioautotrophicum TaxID=617001 RepID=UPI0005EB20A1|nr:FAD-dependent oxidoreductase [Desulfonatronum thioautotrophicum]